MTRLGVRARLTLLAVALVSVLYAVLGAVVFLAARQAIFASIDAGLTRMTDPFLRPHPGGGRPPPGPRPFDRRPDVRPPGQDGDRGFGPPDREGGGGGRGPEDRAGPREPDIHDGRPHLVWKASDSPSPALVQTSVDPVGVEEAKKGVIRLRTVTFEEEPLRVVHVPLYSPQHRLEGVMEMHYWLGDIDRVLAALARTLALILPVGAIVMGLASLFVVGKTLRPVRQIVQSAAKMEASNLEARLPVPGNDEFSELAQTINGLLGRLETAFKGQETALVQLREMFSRQRQFTADASHELKTPLTAIKLNATLIKSGALEGEDLSASLDSIDQAVDRMNRLVRDLMLLARTDSGQMSESFEVVDLGHIARQAKANSACPAKVSIDAPHPVWLRGSPFALERLINNLLENACRHTAEDGRIEVSVSGDPGEARLLVRDDGEGIPPEHLEKIFQRFHRVDASRHSETGGAGLGLAICKGIVEAHGGQISVESQPGAGAAFTVRLPSGRSPEDFAPEILPGRGTRNDKTDS